MKVQKKISVMGDWAKPGEDIKDGTTVTILDGGTVTSNKFGDQTVFKISTLNGEKNLGFNQTTTNNLIDAYGDDTDMWINKTANAYILKVMIAGELKTVVYLAAPGWKMDNKGKFHGPDTVAEKTAEPVINIAEGEVDESEIPF